MAKSRICCADDQIFAGRFNEHNREPLALLAELHHINSWKFSARFINVKPSENGVGCGSRFLVWGVVRHCTRLTLGLRIGDRPIRGRGRARWGRSIDPSHPLFTVRIQRSGRSARLAPGLRIGDCPILGGLLVSGAVDSTCSQRVSLFLNNSSAQPTKRLGCKHLGIFALGQVPATDRRIGYFL
jgi:hypothetical protein